MIDHRRILIAASLGLTVALGALPAMAAPAPDKGAMPVDPVLRTAIDSPLRDGALRARDGARHPLESLEFWGLKPGMTVIDIQPGSGWWTDILAPYLMRTGGHYIAAGADLDNPATSAGARKGRANFEAKYGQKAVYGDVKVVGFGTKSGPLAPPGTIDLVLVSRETHNWVEGNFIAKAFADIHAALKPGGIMAIEDHRARPGADPKKGDGYLSEAYVIEQAKKAGFVLAARSEINANPLDTKDHPFGVWTLPPTRQSAPSGQPDNAAFDHTKYDAIGESDRMTLKFVKAAM
ncbi:class I SAM-dependent methyltransferase [Novosphingobium sp.]|uniref:class I SAM-dependent methyltransferase n=1 Tax=Novosphingobium sp. TaxID=1874826 RepID=UPI003D0B16D4